VSQCKRWMQTIKSWFDDFEELRGPSHRLRQSAVVQVSLGKEAVVLKTPPGTDAEQCCVHLLVEIPFLCFLTPSSFMIRRADRDKCYKFESKCKHMRGNFPMSLRQYYHDCETIPWISLLSIRLNCILIKGYNIDRYNSFALPASKSSETFKTQRGFDGKQQGVIK
jgi:hypothetical protein